MKIGIRFYRNMVAALFVGLIMFGTSFAGPKRGGDMIALYWQFPPHFNAAIKSGAAIAASSAQIFVSLIEMDGNWKATPYLAKSWSVSADKLSYTFKLVEGTVFHDGKPVTSKDVAFSINLMKKNHPFGPYMFGAVDLVQL